MDDRLFPNGGTQMTKLEEPIVVVKYSDYT